MTEKKKLNLESILVISTSHMPSSNPNFGDLRVIKHEYGYIIPVAGMRSAGVDWLQTLWKLAQDLDVSFINFDRDGQFLPGHKTWVW